MKVGLFFGSFNPIHHGHLIIAQAALNQAALDQIWFVVSPQNPHKKSKNLLHEFDRLDLV
jgi:nicotinate-nucleotide adenylyltransferase